MRVVIDSNVFIVALARKFKYHEIITPLKAEVFTMGVTTPIMLEYIEATEQMYGVSAAREMDELVRLPNVDKLDTYFRWQLIVVDSDDNIFVDCAITYNADYLVTNDKHFNILKNTNWPSVDLLTADQFLDILTDKK